jgi:hypothetical protein
VSLTAAERETIVTLNDEDGHAEIWTAQRPIITKLKKNAAATLIAEGKHDGSAWAQFQLPAALVSFRSTRQKRELTAEQRAEIAARLAAGRAT